ncbi:MAG: helix-turn-helix transcriptional regulator [Leptospirales bacterium]
MEPKINTIGERLGDFRKAIGISQTEMSNKANLNRSYVTHIETGKSTPSFDFLVKLMDTYNLSIDWLLTGNGPMTLKECDDDLKTSDDDLIIIRKLNEMPDAPKKIKVRNIINEILDI